MNRLPIRLALNLTVGSLALLVVCGCKRESNPPMKVGDSICIGGTFHRVDETKAYPWVSLSPNPKCAEPGTPNAYVNMDRLESFKPDCTCKYSAACLKKCKESDIGLDKCLSTCTD